MNTTLKKVLSMFLCVVMLFSTASYTLASAADSKENTTDYVYTARHYLKTSDAENAKIALDKVDELLKNQNIKKEVSFGLTKLTIDLTSVNATFETIDNFKDALNFIKGALGDLKDLNLKNWTKDLSRPNNDVEMLNQLIQLLADNAGIIGKVVDGSIDFGLILNSFIDIEDILGKDGVYGLIKKELVKLVYSDEKSAEYKAAYAKKLDNFVYEDVFALFNKEDGALPGFVMNESSTVDSLLISLLASAWKKYIVSAIKGINVDWSNSDNEALKKLSQVICLDGSKFDETKVVIDTSKSFESQINNVLGEVVKFFFPAAQWTQGDISKLSGNIDRVYVDLAKALGLPDSKPITIVKYVVKNLDIEGMDEYVGNVDSWTSVKQAVAVVLTNTAKKNGIPVKASSNYETILGDMLTYAMTNVVSLGYTAGAGKDVWTVLNDILNVFLFDKGFAKALNLKVSAGDTVFQKIDSVIEMTEIFKGLTPAENYKSEKFTKDLLEAIFNLDIAKAVDMTAVTFLGDFGKRNIVEVVYKTLYTTLKSFMGKEVIVPYKAGTPLDNAISNSSLKVTVTNLLTGLNSRRSVIISPVLYLAALVLGLVEPVVLFTTADKPTVPNVVYTGKTVYPTTLTVKGTTYKKDADYTLEAASSVKVGTVNAVVKFFGDIKGPDMNVSYKIVPATPKSLKLSKATSTSVTVSWAKAAGAASYTVYYLTDGKKWSSVTTKSTSATISKLKGNTSYQIKVRAVNGSYVSSYSSVLKVKTNLAAPTGVKVSSGSSSVKVSWTKVTGAASYYVYYSLDNKTWSKVTTKSTSATISKLKANTGYYILVKAVNGSNISDRSATVTTKTKNAAPTTVKASATSTTVTVKWTKAAGATSYFVYYSTDNKKWSKVTTKSTSVKLSKLKANTNYYVMVKAVSGKTVSDGTTVKVKTALAAPTGVKTASTSGTVTVKWSKVSGATSYFVYYSLDGKKWSKVTTKSTSAKISKLKANTNYYVMVKAVNGKAVSDGTTVKVKTAVAAPTSLKLSKATATAAKITWKKSSGAAGYVVYRNGKVVGKTNAKTATFTDKKLKKNTSYKYTVKAYTVVSKKNVYSDSSAVLNVKTAKK